MASRESDALGRRREVYASLATNIRVLMSSTRPASEDEKRGFLAAVDLAYVWADEPVVGALNSVLDLLVRHTKGDATITQAELRDGLKRCMVQIRRHSGFPNTSVEFPLVSF
jgi:hypothetical protein